MNNILITIKNIVLKIIDLIDDYLNNNSTGDDIMNEVFPQKAVDASKHQTAYDPIKCKSSGISTVLFRVAYATTKDKTFDSYVSASKNTGMKIGCYGFGTWHYKSKANSPENARTVMIEQVNSWVNYAKNAGINSWFAIDQELENGQTMALSKSDNTNILLEAARTIENAGFHPCLYASASWIMSNVDLNRFNYPIWVAYYKWYGTQKDFDNVSENFPSNSGTYGRWMNQNKNRICMWQFSSEGFADKYGFVHGSNGLDKNWLYFNPSTNSETDQEPSVVYFTKYTGNSVSIVEALISIGENSAYSYRKTIAAKNGIENYSGTPTQNTQMLNMLKNGTLIKP